MIPETENPHEAKIVYPGYCGIAGFLLHTYARFQHYFTYSFTCSVILVKSFSSNFHLQLSKPKRIITTANQSVFSQSENL